MGKVWEKFERARALPRHSLRAAVVMTRIASFEDDDLPNIVDDRVTMSSLSSSDDDGVDPPASRSFHLGDFSRSAGAAVRVRFGGGDDDDDDDDDDASYDATDDSLDRARVTMGIEAFEDYDDEMRRLTGMTLDADDDDADDDDASRGSVDTLRAAAASPSRASRASSSSSPSPPRSMKTVARPARSALRPGFFGGGGGGGGGDRGDRDRGLEKSDDARNFLRDDGSPYKYVAPYDAPRSPARARDAPSSSSFAPLSSPSSSTSSSSALTSSWDGVDALALRERLKDFIREKAPATSEADVERLARGEEEKFALEYAMIRADDVDLATRRDFFEMRKDDITERGGFLVNFLARRGTDVKDFINEGKPLPPPDVKVVRALEAQRERDPESSPYGPEDNIYAHQQFVAFVVRYDHAVQCEETARWENVFTWQTTAPFEFDDDRAFSTDAAMDEIKEASTLKGISILCPDQDKKAAFDRKFPRADPLGPTFLTPRGRSVHERGEAVVNARRRREVLSLRATASPKETCERRVCRGWINRTCGGKDARGRACLHGSHPGSAADRRATAAAREEARSIPRQFRFPTSTTPFISNPPTDAPLTTPPRRRFGPGGRSPRRAYAAAAPRARRDEAVYP